VFIIKRLLKNVTASTGNSADSNNKFDFSFTDLADILNQLDELKQNVAVKNDEGKLLLAVGDSIYEITDPNSHRYPRRRLNKRET